MAAFSYEYTGNLGTHKVSAQVAGEVCEQLQQSAAGLSPQTLLDYSRDENAPTHDEFEWNDEVAAEKFRLKQAQNLIIDIRVVQVNVVQGTKEKDRAFVVTPERKSAYVSIQSALDNDTWRESLLRQAKADSEIFLAKYQRLEELAKVNQAMTEFIENVG